MTTQEDRHSREYNKSFSNNGKYDRASLREGAMSFDVKLKNEVSKCMKGFRATNVIIYKRFRDKSTWHRPGEVINLFTDEDDEDEFTPDPKETWPIMQNMNIELPIKEITKRHRVLDRNWTVPPSTKKYKQPEPVYPQSTGVKLRPVEDIMNEYSKASSSSQYKAPPAPTKLGLAKNTAPPPSRVQDKTNCLLEPIPDKIKGVLQNLTDTTRRKQPVSAKPAPKIYATKPNNNDKIHKSNVPRRPSLLKSAISPENLDSKKPPAPVNVAQSTNTSNARPRVSSKSMPIASTTSIVATEKAKYTENIPDLIEARKYLLGDVDEVEFRNLKNLAETPRVTDSMERPILFIHFPKVIDEMTKIGKALDSKKSKSRAGKTVISNSRSSKSSVNNNKKPLNNVQQEEKPALQPTHTSKKTNNSKLMSKSAASNKSIKTDSSAQSSKRIPIKAEPNTTSKNIITNNNTPSVTKKSLSDQNNHSQPKLREDGEKPAIVPEEGEKQVYPSSVSAAFLKSIKIPKRVNKVTDMELEEGETISPSPSPIRNQSDSARKPSRSSTSTSASTNTKEVDDNDSSRKRSNRRREEERSTKRDEERSSSSRRDSRSESRRERGHRSSYHRSRSRTRSRSPTRDNHRSQSRTNRRPERSERKTSPEPSHERRRSPPTRTERDNHKRKSSSSDNDTNNTTTSHTLTSKITKHGDSEPPTKRQATEKKISLSDEEKDKKDNKYTNSNNTNVSSSSNKSGHISKKTLPSTSSKNTPKSISTPINATTASTASTTAKTTGKTTDKTTAKAIDKTTTVTSSATVTSSTTGTSSTTASTTAKAATTPITAKTATTPIAAKTTVASSASSSTSAASLPTESSISATAPNAETPEQYKVFTIMFNKSAHASKRRGDSATDPVFSILDHFHALCDYILNFYYVDKANPQVPFKQASIAWKSLFPFSDSLIKRLETHKLNDLYGLCVRLISLIRYYIYSRMESSTRPLLTKQLVNGNDESYTDRSCIEMTEGLLREHEKAERCYVDSERFLTYGTIATQFPETFKNVCIQGNVLAGIMLGGEAGVSVGPMFPFTPYSPLHHAAIASKCILSEYVTKNSLRYTPISKPEEFM